MLVKDEYRDDYVSYIIFRSFLFKIRSEICLGKDKEKHVYTHIYIYISNEQLIGFLHQTFVMILDILLYRPIQHDTCQEEEEEELYRVRWVQQFHHTLAYLWLIHSR